MPLSLPGSLIGIIPTPSTPVLRNLSLRYGWGKGPPSSQGQGQLSSIVPEGWAMVTAIADMEQEGGLWALASGWNGASVGLGRMPGCLAKLGTLVQEVFFTRVAFACFV